MSKRQLGMAVCYTDGSKSEIVNFDIMIRADGILTNQGRIQFKEHTDNTILVADSITIYIAGTDIKLFHGDLAAQRTISWGITILFEPQSVTLNMPYYVTNDCDNCSVCSGIRPISKMCLAHYSGFIAEHGDLCNALANLESTELMIKLINDWVPSSQFMGELSRGTPGAL